jgi:hypothetical protein
MLLDQVTAKKPDLWPTASPYCLTIWKTRYGTGDGKHDGVKDIVESIKILTGKKLRKQQHLIPTGLSETERTN